MPYTQKNKKQKLAGATILWIILGVFYSACGIVVVCIWLAHNRNIKETKKVLLDTKNKTEEVVKDTIEDAGKTANKTVKEVTQKTKNILSLDDETRKNAEAISELEAARTEKITELKRRKDRLDLEISSADSRHRAATRTVPITPAFEINDSEATRRISEQQSALRAKLRKEADDAACELRRLNLERQQVLHQIRQLEK